MIAVDMPEQQTKFDINVLCELRADWNSILAHAYQTLARLPCLAIICQSRSLMSIASCQSSLPQSFHHYIFWLMQTNLNPNKPSLTLDSCGFPAYQIMQNRLNLLSWLEASLWLVIPNNKLHCKFLVRFSQLNLWLFKMIIT